MKLTIEAGTIEELMAKVNEIANHFNVDLSKSTKTPVTAEVVQVAETVVVEEEKPKKAKAPRKEKVEEAEKVITYTKEALSSALQKVVEAKNMDVAKEILATFGYSKVRDVKEEHYGEIIEACEGSLN